MGHAVKVEPFKARQFRDAAAPVPNYSSKSLLILYLDERHY